MRYVYEPGEERYIWLDEDGERTSHHHKTIETAWAYRRALEAHLSGKPQRIGHGRRQFEPQGTGKPAVKLVKVRMVMQEVELSDEDRGDIAALERLSTRR